jgi:hypothetical protein
MRVHCATTTALASFVEHPNVTQTPFAPEDGRKRRRCELTRAPPQPDTAWVRVGGMGTSPQGNAHLHGLFVEDLYARSGKPQEAGQTHSAMAP